MLESFIPQCFDRVEPARAHCGEEPEHESHSDCAPDVGTTYAVPAEVNGVRAGSGGALSWNDCAGAHVFDLYRGTRAVGAEFVADSDCLVAPEWQGLFEEKVAQVLEKL